MLNQRQIILTKSGTQLMTHHMNIEHLTATVKMKQNKKMGKNREEEENSVDMFLLFGGRREGRIAGEKPLY